MIRAASARDYLAFLDQEEPGVQGRIRALMPPDVERRIDDASMLGWIDIADNLELLKARDLIMGSEAGVVSGSLFISRFARSRFLRGLVKASGLTAKGILRKLPKSLRHFYRNVCEVEVTMQEHGRAQVLLKEIAPSLMGSTLFLNEWRGILVGLMLVADIKSEAEIIEEDQAARSAIYQLTWES
jgi:hypothetical protein